MERHSLISRNPRGKALMKFSFDLIACLLIVVIYFVNAFSYGDTYKISMEHITKKFDYGGMDAYTLTTFKEFDRNYCENPQKADAEVCD